MSYNHLSITERELIAIYRAEGKSICQIAKLLVRNKSTISRELARNPGDYSPSKAQTRYKRRRQKCRPHNQWSPEQIANRLKLENVSNRGKIPISHELSAAAIGKQTLLSATITNRVY